MILPRLHGGKVTLSLVELRLCEVKSSELIVEDGGSLLPSFPGLRERVGAVDHLTQAVRYGLFELINEPCISELEWGAM